MTEKTLVECDGDWCNPTATHPGDPETLPREWATLEGKELGTRHLCPECSWRALQWAVNGRSGGAWFAVKHNYVGTEGEEAHISPGTDVDAVDNAGTHSFWVQPLLDEQDLYPAFEFGEDEGWHLHAHDHFGLSVIGKHKDEPRVVLEPEEFTTQFEVRESVAGHSLDYVLVEVKRVTPRDA